MVTGLGHVNLGVSDIEKSVEFYSKALGMEEMFRLINDEGVLCNVYLKVCHQQYIELSPAGYKPTESPTQSFRHICLHVSDMDAVIARVKESGYAIGTPKTGADGNLQAFMRDPDDTIIELMQLSPTGMQLSVDRKPE
ncbi:MAG: VOC family protein [Oscillospiraceae bacterium]|nr:VOC family protein [Oscillospiraceae bacterium]